MTPSPYRTAADLPADPAPLATPTDDAELLPVFLIVWLSSLVRVGFGLAHGEVFGTELTLAAMAVIALPFLLKDALWAALRRAGRSKNI